MFLRLEKANLVIAFTWLSLLIYLRFESWVNVAVISIAIILQYSKKK